MVIRNDGEEEVSTIQLAADAVNANRLIYLVAKIDNKKQTLSVDYKINLEKPLAKGLFKFEPRKIKFDYFFI